MAVLRESQQVLNNSSSGHGMNNSWKEGESNSDSMMLSKVDSALNKWAEKNDIELTDELKGAVYGSIDGEGGFIIQNMAVIALLFWMTMVWITDIKYCCFHLDCSF